MNLDNCAILEEIPVESFQLVLVGQLAVGSISLLVPRFINPLAKPTETRRDQERAPEEFSWSLLEISQGMLNVGED